MAPIPIFTQSPLNASKADGVTPKTAEGPDQPSTPRGQEATTTAAPPPTSTSPYPAPQPGARPAAPPAPTPTATYTTTAHARYASVDSTADAAYGNGMNPPPPQPGAVPAPRNRTSLPPPPKAGETMVSDPSRDAAARAGSFPTAMPPQMGIPPPTAPQVPGGTSAAVPTGPRPTSLFEGGPGTAPGNHPPGYQQVPYQQGTYQQQQGYTQAGSAGYPRPSNQARGQGVLAGEEEDDGVWGATKKWAQTAGGSIAAAEDEIWRRINKG